MTQCPGFRQIADSLTRRDQEGFQGSYSARVANGWTQGHSIFGGMVVGLAYEAAQAEFKNLPPLRSVLVNFIGPIAFGEAGCAVFTPSLLRQGKNVSSINVDVSSEYGLGARVNFVFGAARESVLCQSIRIKPLDDPLSYPSFTPPQFESFVPKFFLQFETRLVAGHRPMSGADEGYIDTAIRHKDPYSRGDDIGSLLTLADALPPAATPLLKKLAPVSSITWLLNILTDRPQTDEGWWRLDGRMSTAQNGYSTEQMGIWNAAGEKVAEGMQSVAVFA